MDAVARNGTVWAAFSAACVHPLTNVLFSCNKAFSVRLHRPLSLRCSPHAHNSLRCRFKVHHRIARLRNVATLAKQVALVSAAGWTHTRMEPIWSRQRMDILSRRYKGEGELAYPIFRHDARVRSRQREVARANYRVLWSARAPHRRWTKRKNWSRQFMVAPC